jgi:putative transcriptional regulator
MKKKISVEEALIQGLKEARDYEAGKKKLNSSMRELPPPAPEFTGKKIKKLREVFGATQDEFATIMNVKVATVRSWEQGQRKPADASNRLLEILEKQGPEQILSLLKGA